MHKALVSSHTRVVAAKQKNRIKPSHSDLPPNISRFVKNGTKWIQLQVTRKKVTLRICKKETPKNLRELKKARAGFLAQAATYRVEVRSYRRKAKA